jgi:hypothetical protein
MGYGFYFVDNFVTSFKRALSFGSQGEGPDRSTAARASLLFHFYLFKLMKIHLFIKAKWN